MATGEWRLAIGEDGVSSRACYTVLACALMMVMLDGGVTAQGGLLLKVDHLVYAVPDLQAGIDRIDTLLGVRATPGGQHPGVGTRNALVSLGPATYLEIIGPDPEQPAPAQPRTFGIDSLAAPSLVTWAAKSSSLESLVRDAGSHGITFGQVSAGSRRTPGGTLLQWRYTSPRTVIADGLVPFFIDWGTTPHPASMAATGATLVGLRAEHPDPNRVRELLKQLGLDLSVTNGSRPALVATIQCPRGTIELR
jgi:Glyoxalase-like domain